MSNISDIKIDLEYLIDEHGYKHYLDKKLGQGGQGAVFSTTDKNVVIKVVLNQSTGQIVSNKDRYIKFKDNIDEVRILPLPKDMHIAKPIHLLKEPINGYVMRLLSDMIPIKKLIIPDEDSITKFYIKTGGLRRRLALLKNIAKDLARLNSMSIVYADISPENIFVSSNIEEEETWFIDADNMRYMIDFDKPIYTPGYGAPEVVRCIASNNTLSDIYSFAILAFELLSLTSPFEGELLLDGENWEDEWSDEIDYYEKAERGEIPWIEDKEDDSNFSDKGIPRSIVLSSKLMELFQRTFGREGRENPLSRPSMSEWYEVLSQAESATIKCKKCNSTFYLGKNLCPFCNEQRDRIYQVRIYDYFNKASILVDDICEENNFNCEIRDEDISLFKQVGFKVLDIDNEKKYLYSNEVMNILISDEITKAIEIEKKQLTTAIKNLMDRDIIVIDQNQVHNLKKNESYHFYDLENIKVLIKTDNLVEKRVFFKLL